MPTIVAIEYRNLERWREMTAWLEEVGNKPRVKPHDALGWTNVIFDDNAVAIMFKLRFGGG